MPRIRWIGHKRRYINFVDEHGNLIRDAAGNPVTDYDREWELERDVPWVGVTRLILDPKLEQEKVMAGGVPTPLVNLSQRYTFGLAPGTFTQTMTDEDWTLLQEHWAAEVFADGSPKPIPFAEVGEDDDGGQYDPDYEAPF